MENTLNNNDEDGTYYIGQFRNGLFNGKGTEYYSNGKIQYEGDYVNGNREGKGKYIWEDGQYFIGQWKNDLRNGKGILYYSNEKIKYEGDYVDDKKEGYGKCI
jgi:antitoxin component YwqK of YwqJK toxin-antitoxin module